MTGRLWRYLRLNLYPFGGTALAAFETYTYSCDRMAFLAFEGNPYPCGGTALAAFDTNTYSYDRTALAAFEVNSLPLWRDIVGGFRLTLYACGGMALAAFVATTKIPLSEGPDSLICQGPFGPPLALH